MIYNWSKYRRKLNNIEKSEFNYLVNELLVKHYRYLHSKLVKSEKDEATFNDSYLRLTRKYNPDLDFIELFVYCFKLLSGEYMRDDKCYNYAETKVADYNLTNSTNLETILYEINLILTNSGEKSEASVELTKQPKITKQNFIITIKLYAILEKKQKLKAKVTKKD